MVKKRTVLLYPSLGEKSGTGHLKRVLQIYNDERFNSYLICSDMSILQDFSKSISIDKERVLDLKNIDTVSDVDFIVLDNRTTDKTLYNRLASVAPIVAIDEGGYARRYSQYLVDLLPNLEKEKPNYYNPGLLGLPVKKRAANDLNRVLVTFGGQDPYSLTAKAVAALKDKFDITVIIGPLFSTKDFGVTQINNPDSLKNILHQYDLVVTSYGLTAFEAAKSEVPVALLNPTQYHQKLSEKAGFYTVSDCFNIDYSKAKESTLKIDIGEDESLTDFLHMLEPSQAGCPVCGSYKNRIKERFLDKTFYECNSCSVIYMIYHKPNKDYNGEYFNAEYKEQYGKTYLEDFDHIKNVGKSRLKYIFRKLNPGDTILDIGCAFGPFLDACKDAGLSPFGIDPSREGVNYVNSKLKIPAVNTLFPLESAIEMPSPFDSVTMWYVIEHFCDLGTVLEEINKLLKKGGVFAFSTPNVAGISGKRSIKKFYRNNPTDHFTLLSPKSARKVLKKYGFKVYKINVTGHHPGRFGSWVKGNFMSKLILSISKVLRLGDTFEMYAIKE